MYTRIDSHFSDLDELERPLPVRPLGAPHIETSWFALAKPPSSLACLIGLVRK